EAHIADCNYCLGQVAALARLEEAGVPGEVPPPLLAKARALVEVPAAPLRTAWRWGAAAAAATCLAVVLMFSARQPRPIGVPAVQSVRRAPDSAMAPVLLFPTEGALVPRHALAFRWREIDRSLFYDVQILSAEGEVIWAAHINGPEAQIPAGVRLSPGQKYYVSLDAWLPEGKAIKYPIVGFQVKYP
ncbi:MAG: hypothetical protein JWO48_3790, partial [Bryobacterales bacterium]|nr:hypothetical protein [Bryobacterales bacterium]